MTSSIVAPYLRRRLASSAARSSAPTRAPGSWSIPSAAPRRSSPSSSVSVTRVRSRATSSCNDGSMRTAASRCPSAVRSASAAPPSSSSPIAADPRVSISSPACRRRPRVAFSASSSPLWSRAAAISSAW